MKKSCPVFLPPQLISLMSNKPYFSPLIRHQSPCIPYAFSGFPLGSTVQSETKGIWMWCVPHPHKNDQTLVLLDTEGLGDVAKVEYPFKINFREQWLWSRLHWNSSFFFQTGRPGSWHLDLFPSRPPELHIRLQQHGHHQQWSCDELAVSDQPHKFTFMCRGSLLSMKKLYLLMKMTLQQPQLSLHFNTRIYSFLRTGLSIGPQKHWTDTSLTGPEG